MFTTNIYFKLDLIINEFLCIVYVILNKYTFLKILYSFGENTEVISTMLKNGTWIANQESQPAVTVDPGR